MLGMAGLDSLPRMSCMAQTLRRQVRMASTNLKLGLSQASNSEVPFREEGKWKPCKIASSFGSPVHVNVLGQSRRTMGEGLLDQRLELLPDACLAARAFGNLVAVFSNDRDYSVILHSRNLGREKLPASTQ